jgi:geranylgeranyl diphosphate synthase, type II
VAVSPPNQGDWFVHVTRDPSDRKRFVIHGKKEELGDHEFAAAKTFTHIYDEGVWNMRLCQSIYYVRNNVRTMDDVTTTTTTTISEAIVRTLERDASQSPLMKRICMYGCTGGKYVRPLLMLEMSRVASRKVSKGMDENTRDAVLRCAVSLEFIHSASLMIDDIIDGDLVRRGKDSCHVVFGTTACQLAAAHLSTVALVNVCDIARDSHDPEVGIALISCEIQNLHRMNLGQYAELFPETNDVHVDQVEDVILAKTGALFEVALVQGWLLGGGGIEAIPEVSRLAMELGMLHQLADDVDDRERDAAKDGSLTFNHLIRAGKEGTLRRALAAEEVVYSVCARLGIRSPKFIDEVVQRSLKIISLQTNDLKK